MSELPPNQPEKPQVDDMLEHLECYANTGPRPVPEFDPWTPLPHMTEEEEREFMQREDVQRIWREVGEEAGRLLEDLGEDSEGEVRGYD